MNENDLVGLSSAEAAQRLARFGANALREDRVSPFMRLARFFWGPIPWMIEIAALLSALVAHWADLVIILVMLLVNAGVGFWQEFKADNAIALLKQRLAPRARARRDGRWQDLPADQLVPGDVVMLRIGNIVPADATLRSGAYLSIDQAALTGESLPVDKGPGDAVYSGSIVKQGEMIALVSATGMATYFGRTAHLVAQASRVSHFQRAVLRIGHFLIAVTIALVLLIGFVALFRRDPLAETLQFALILTVASIPVALPAVMSVTMAVGASKLARLRAIVARLVAIEELAGMNVLCVDKTGTLTQNTLTLGALQPRPGISEAELRLHAALACDRDAPDAIDAAILAAFPDQGGLAAYAVRAFEPFDPVKKYAKSEIEHDGAILHAAKGAPQVIADLCALSSAERDAVAQVVADDAEKGFRTLGVAREDAAGAWQLLGFVQLYDPPRPDSATTIAMARKLGIAIKMVTGDHEAIARQIAAQLDIGANIVVADEVFGADGSARQAARIAEADGFARVFPEHKFEIVRALQNGGDIVGMTGDGVNDAPALKQSDVGFAVSGASDAARAAADLVLTAPGLDVITTAIEEARRIFERMTSYAIFRISETVRVLLFMTLSILVFNFYPVTAIMIVLLALLNDLPIMMIAYDNAPVAVRPVRWDMPRVLTIATVLGIFGVFGSFGLFWLARDYLSLPPAQVQTMVFLKLLVAGHLTIYLTRNAGPFWQRPWPSWRLIVPTEITQIVGTLAAVYGWFMTPIGWRLALIVWAYAIGLFLIAGFVKLAAEKALRVKAFPRSGEGLHLMG